MLLFGSLVLSDNLHVLGRLVEGLSPDGTHILELVVTGPCSSVQVSLGILQLLVNVAVDLLGFVEVSFGEGSLVADLHQLA